MMSDRSLNFQGDALYACDRILFILSARIDYMCFYSGMLFDWGLVGIRADMTATWQLRSHSPPQTCAPLRTRTDFTAIRCQQQTACWQARHGTDLWPQPVTPAIWARGVPAGVGSVHWLELQNCTWSATVTPDPHFWSRDFILHTKYYSYLPFPTGYLSFMIYLLSECRHFTKTTYRYGNTTYCNFNRQYSPSTRLAW